MKFAKISYSYLSKLKAKINGHNKKILNEKQPMTKRTCNCIKEEECPVNGKCFSKILYVPPHLLQVTKITNLEYTKKSVKPNLNYNTQTKNMVRIGVSTPIKNTTPSFSPSPLLNLQTFQAPLSRQSPLILREPPPKNRIFQGTPIIYHP